MLHYKSMSELKRFHNGYFFSKGAMRFFNSLVYPNVRTGHDGWYFVTSERWDERSPRLYTVRRMNPNGEISTMGEFQGFSTFDDALEAATEMAKGKL